MEYILAWFLENLSYGAITLLMAIESSFIPFPSEVVVPPAAWKAGLGEDMNIGLVVLFATLGADIGALLNYYLAKYLGQSIVYRFAGSKLGRLCLINEEKIKKAEDYFRKHGAISTFIGRLVPGVRQLISIPAGLSNMGLGKFLLYTTLGALAWNSILAGIGYYLSFVPGINTQEELLRNVKSYSSEIGYVFLALAVMLVVYAFMKSKRTTRKVA